MKFQLKRTRADKLFSDYIRLRDNYTCQKCHVRIPPPTKDIHCAHFHSRSKKSVRFDPENCLSLCTKCHFYFDGNSWLRIDSHRAEFEEFMKKRLGEEKLNLLLFRANRPEKVDEELIAVFYKGQIELLKKVSFNKVITKSDTKRAPVHVRDITEGK